MKKADLKGKFIELIKEYGNNGELEIFGNCPCIEVHLAGSTIDKIEATRWGDVYLYYNENINDYDRFESFNVKDLQKFYTGIRKKLKENFAD